MIYDFINDICDILNIPTPFISFDTSNFSTDTMMAQCSPDGSTIYIKKYDKQPNPNETVKIYDENGCFIGIYEFIEKEKSYKPVKLFI